MTTCPTDEVSSREVRGRWSLRHYAMLAALWTIPAVAGTFDNYYWRRAHGMAVPFAWMALAEFPKWVIWIPLTPLVLRLGRRFRVAPPVRWQAVTVHVIVCLALSVTQAIIVAVSLLAIQQKVDWWTFRELALFAFANWFPVMLLAYPIVVGLGYALEVADRLRREQVHAAMVSGRLAQAQLAALRTQLHPHMMFNSLNTAVSLVRTGDNELAVGVLTDLSEILRQVLRGAAIQEVPLSDEIRFVERCVALERARFPNRIAAVFDVGWSVRDALVPNLILQPIVENAMRHGITRREEGGLLEIVARAEDGMLVLSVLDNGPGFRDVASPPGLGLNITSERLHYLYGGRASLRLANRPGGGAEVVLRLPLDTRPAAPRRDLARNSSPPLESDWSWRRTSPARPGSGIQPGG
jgi:signal transduction histidine kinase